MGYVEHENLHVITTTTAMAIILPIFAPFEFSELGAPKATKTIDLGSDKITVVM